MQLWIAEKPSVAKAICAELGIVKKGAGFNECKGGNTVTWCFGHLLEHAGPDAYTPDDVPVTKKGGKIWRMQDLPIFPSVWKLNVKPDRGVKAQLKTIKLLLGKCDSIVNCGDPDREGQLLVDEILEFYKCRKPVSRFWVSAQDPASIKKGLKSLKPNSQFQGMKLAALGRSRADWLLGMNLTRALTLTHGAKERKLIAVGRVQTPTLALVAERDKTIKNFKAVPYFVLKAEVSSGRGSFTALWKPSDVQKGLDSEGRLVNPAVAKSLSDKLKPSKTAVVRKTETVPKKMAQPRAFSLADIQLEASNKYGFSAQETLDTCQSLYEIHKAASYPRSDWQYLPESQFTDAPKVLAAIAKTCPNLKELVLKADPSIKSQTWNDKKITAHHGIIPTQLPVEWAALSDKEQKIYELIGRRYLAQFFPIHQFNSSSIDLDLGGETFIGKGKTVTSLGWKVVYQNQTDPDTDKTESDQILPSVKSGDILKVLKTETKNELTKPPAYFTEGTLIAAMEKIHTVVDNPEYKKYLKEGDGIGTPATRAVIISELKRKGYLETKGKKICASSDGIELLKLVPELVRNPILTAVFERKLRDVESGKSTLGSFIESQQKFILQEINKAKAINNGLQ